MTRCLMPLDEFDEFGNAGKVQPVKVTEASESEAKWLATATMYLSRRVPGLKALTGNSFEILKKCRIGRGDVSCRENLASRSRKSSNAKASARSL